MKWLRNTGECRCRFGRRLGGKLVRGPSMYEMEGPRRPHVAGFPIARCPVLRDRPLVPRASPVTPVCLRFRVLESPPLRGISGFPVLPSSRSLLRVGPRFRWRRAISSACRDGAQGLSANHFRRICPSPGCPQNSGTSPPVCRCCPPSLHGFIHSQPRGCPHAGHPAADVMRLAVRAGVGAPRRRGRTARARPRCGWPGRPRRCGPGRPASARRRRHGPAPGRSGGRSARCPRP